MITIELPKALGLAVNGKSTVEIDESCRTVGDVFNALKKRAPDVTDRLLDDQGKIREHVNVFTNGENIRYLQGPATPTPDGTNILILAAISGG